MTSVPAEQLASWLDAHLVGRILEFCAALSGGNSNLTWQFQSGDRACVVRTPPANDISPTSARGIQREAQMLQAIAGFDVRAPAVLAWCDDASVIGRSFLVQEFIDGRALTDPTRSLSGHHRDGESVGH